MAKDTSKPAPERETSASPAGLLSAALRRALLKRQEAQAPEVGGAGRPQRLPPRPASTPQAPSKASARSPLATDFPTLPAIAGVELAAAAAGIRYRGRDDVLLAVLPPGTAVGGVFTRSKIVGAPVLWCRESLESDVPEARALVVNSGNANVFTGKAGAAAVQDTADAVAKLVKCKPRQVYVASTGVIGEPLPVAKLKSALPGLAKARNAAAKSWLPAARAIMTTDTFPKGATRKTEIDGVTVTINGIAKGSGMIAPDMATLLAFLFTDASLPSPVAQTLLMLGLRGSFNAISVDSDTSTSDSVLLFATGKAAHKPVTRAGDPRLRDFRVKLNEVMQDLALQVVRDGEGASKFITVTVTGAESARAARVVALSIANSPLVKTAIAGGDANWGRIAMAVGKSGESVDPVKLRIRMCNLTVAEKGARAPRHDDAKLMAAMKAQDIPIDVDLGIGPGKATIWTCDLTHGYIDINGSYRS